MTIKLLNIFLLTLFVFANYTASNAQDTLAVSDSSILDSSIFVPRDSSKMIVDTLGNDSLSVEILEISDDAVEEPINYKARDSILFAVGEQKVYLYGEAQINYQDIELKAEYIELDLGKDLVFAIGVADSVGGVVGEPEFKDGKDEFSSKEMLYNFKTKKGIVKEVITEQNGGYLHSRVTKIQPNKEVHIKDGKYTTCDLEHPHFYIKLTKAKVIPDDKIVSGPAYLIIEDVPVPLGIPFGFFPNNSGHTSGILIPEYGEELNRGFFLRNGGYYFTFGDYADLQARADIYSKGSWGANAVARYKKMYKFNGNLNLKYSSIKIFEDSVPNKMYQIKWQHSQDSKARPNSRFSANVDFGSSSYDQYNSYGEKNRLRNEMSSSISYNKSFANTPFSLSTNLRHSQNTQDSTVTLSLPEISFNMSRIYPLKKRNKVGKSKWYEQVGITYSTNFKNSIKVREDTLFRKEALDYFRNGVKHSIPVSTSLKVFKVFTLNPSFTYTERWYAQSIRKDWYNEVITTTIDTATNDTITTITDGYYDVRDIKGFHRAGDYMINIPFSTKIYGFFMNKNPDGYFQALRHVVTPTFGFSYRPDYSLNYWGYYKNDPRTNSYDSKYSIFNGGAGEWNGVFGSPPSGKSGAINMRIGNNLELKVRQPLDSLGNSKPKPPIKLIDDLSIATNYNIAADSLNWSDFILQARTKVSVFNINCSAIFDPYDYDDSTGYAINKFYYEDHSELARLSSARFSIGFNLRSSTTNKQQRKSEEAKIQSARAAGMLGDYYTDYVDFEIPWNFRIDYDFNYSQSGYNYDNLVYDYKTIQTLRFSGDVNITKKWKVSASTGYDWEKKDFTYTTIDIYRDLHCWEMRFNWIPFGKWQSYNFTINVKSTMLQDLKINRRKSWADNF